VGDFSFRDLPIVVEMRENNLEAVLPYVKTLDSRCGDPGSIPRILEMVFNHSMVGPPGPFKGWSRMGPLNGLPIPHGT